MAFRPKNLGSAAGTPSGSGKLQQGQAQKSPTQSWQDLCNQQGWSEESQVIHFEGFLEDRGLMAEFVAYAQAAAVEENREADGETMSPCM